ncbi:hypothetical protein JNJ66_05690 [Candidatus Saccharibacteria bacterium]|nr:hypothetical protein [Candidatus Saccharibacteria bacterium]
MTAKEALLASTPATLTPAELAGRIRSAYGDITFVVDDDFFWSAGDEQLHYRPAETAEDIWCLLHEIGHARLKHADYTTDVELLGHEVDAWEWARKAAGRFGVALDDDFIQDQLDTYRFWLHARSRCPDCQQTGLQHPGGHYACLNCPATWHANDARRRRLQRTRL